MKKIIHILAFVALTTLAPASVSYLDVTELKTTTGKLECAECVHVHGDCSGTDSGGSCKQGSRFLWIPGCIDDNCGDREVPPTITNGYCTGFKDSVDCVNNDSYTGSAWNGCLTICGPTVAGICACTKVNGSFTYIESNSKDCKETAR